MRTPYISVCVFVLTVFSVPFLVSCATTPSARAENHREWVRDECKKRWDARILEVFRIGRSEDEIMQDMQGLYFATGRYTTGGSGTYERVFLIDDYFEIAPLFDVSGHLIAIPVLEPRSKWLRFPDAQWLRGPNQTAHPTTL